MLAIISNASQPVDDPSQLPGKFAYSFWVPSKSIILASNTPFSRNDLVTVEPTAKDNVFLLDPVSLDDVDNRMLKEIGYLSLMCTDIPLSSDVKYTFEVDHGEAEPLTILRTNYNEQVYYLLLYYIKSPTCRIVGYDSVHNDGGVEFLINMNSQLNEFMNSLARHRNRKGAQ